MELKIGSWNFRHVITTFIISQLAWPCTWMFNFLFTRLDQTGIDLWMMISAYCLFVVLIFFNYRISTLTDWLYFGAALFAFTAVIDLIIALEIDGAIQGFMHEYLVSGERYLFSSWGFSIGIFDLIFFFPMYLGMIFCMENGINYKWICLYWAGGLMESMLTEVYAIIGGVGDFAPNFCSLINIPYCILPIAGLYRALHMEDTYIWADQLPFRMKSLKEKIWTCVLAMGLFLAIWFNFALGFGTIGTEVGFLKCIWSSFPAITLVDPLPFTKFQGLVLLFYIVPVQILHLVYLFQDKQPQFLWDTALFQAGIILQGQWNLMVVGLHPATPMAFRSDASDAVFWLTNLVNFGVPHLYIGHMFRSWKKPQTQSPPSDFARIL